ncbi:MAG: hypothetical protein V7L09_28380 [Nostoc sp.]|uniref:hypothetical protein n=1 Tax=Nostoc sp. TaxID=1180 RepID=UPI002FF0A6FC
MIFGTAYFRCCLLLAVAGRLARAELGVLSAELGETRLIASVQELLLSSLSSFSVPSFLSLVPNHEYTAFCNPK